MVEPGDGGVEGALGREGADVQLVEDRAGQRHAAPVLVGPGERAVVDEPRRPVDAVRLPGAARVGPRVAAVEDEGVVEGLLRRREVDRPPAVLAGGHRPALLAELELDGRRPRGPHGERRHGGCPCPACPATTHSVLTRAQGRRRPSDRECMTSIDDVLPAQGVRSVFQPILDLESGAVVAYEALARGPEGDARLPRPAVRGRPRGRPARRARRGLPPRRLLRRRRSTGCSRPLTLFVNVEPEVLDNAPLDDLLAIAEAAPGQLQVVLEITERALAARPADLLRTVERVRALGWAVALDDVGADAMSLAFMPLLRPEVVKLDLRLVQERPGQAVAEIMNAVNDYAERTGALLLAEGIETEEHLRMARALGRPARAGLAVRPPRATARPPPSPSGELVLPAADRPLDVDESPFACLPADTPLRRSPEGAAHRGQQAARAAGDAAGRDLRRRRDLPGGEALHAVDRPALPRPGRADRLRLRARRGPAGRAGPRRARRGARPGRPGPRRVGHHRRRAALQRRPARPRPRRHRARPRPDVRVRPDLRPRHRRARHERAAVPRRAPAAGAAAEDGPAAAAAAVPRADAGAGRRHRRRRGAAAPGAGGDHQRRHDRRRRPPRPAARLRQQRLRAAVGLPGRGAARRQLPLPAGPRHRPGRGRAGSGRPSPPGEECRETLLNYRGPDRTPWWNEIYLAPVVDPRARCGSTSACRTT